MPADQETVGGDDERAHRMGHHLVIGVVDFAFVGRPEGDKFLAERFAGGLQVGKLRLGVRVVRVHEHPDRRRLGNYLAQQLQVLARAISSRRLI